MARIAAGILTKKIHCPPRALTRRPPNAGRAKPGDPTTLTCLPRALPRSLLGKMEVSMARVVP